MKEELKYLALWQDKRNQWPVNGDTDTDWQVMQSLLDEHLPNPIPPGNTGGSNGPTGIGGRFLKLWAIVAIIILAAIALYLLMHTANPQLKQQPISTKDSLTALQMADSLRTEELESKKQIIAYSDSIKQAEQQLNKAEAALKTWLSADNKTIKVKDSITAIRQTLAAANQTLTRLVAARSNIPGYVKQVNSHGASGSGYLSPASTVPEPSANGDSIPVNTNNIPNGINYNNGKGTGENSLPAGNKKRANDAANALNGKHNNPTGGNSNGNSAKHELTGLPGDTKANDTGNKLQGNSNGVSNAGDDSQRDLFNNKTSSLPGNDMVDILSAINGYHPDVDVFGHMISSGSYPFKNSLLPGDMRYSPRVYPTGGSSKIKVNKPDKPKKEKKVRAPKNPGDTTANFDWGILAGVNTNGSFTGKSQNANIYGSLPLDIYTGLYGTYHFNGRFGLQAQTWLLNPLKFSGGYSHANGSKVEKSAIIQVTDSRKVYFVTVPVSLMYRVTGNFSIKAGPVLNLPVKQSNGITALTPTIISRDTAYYKTTTEQLKATKYDKKLTFGLSGGIQIQTGRLLFDASYLKSMSGYKVVSDYGTYTNSPGVFQFTVGFQLNRVR